VLVADDRTIGVFAGIQPNRINDDEERVRLNVLRQQAVRAAAYSMGSLVQRLLNTIANNHSMPDPRKISLMRLPKPLLRPTITYRQMVMTDHGVEVLP
jgi:hypothetical protein